MRVSLVFATLLCFTMWKSSVHEVHLPLTSCCMVWSKIKVELTRIANYTIQLEGVCPKAAIRFETRQGKTICSDPNNGWAKRAKAKVDEESRKNILQNNRQNDEGATSDMTPATATTSTYTTQRFRTKTGGTICSDRNGDCAKEDVLKEDEEDRKNTLQENGQNDEEASGDIPPAPATTSTYTMQRENGQNDKGATSNITPATATTSTYTTVTCASDVCSAHVTTTQRENGQNDKGATSDITPTTTTTSKLHLTEKPKVQRENGPKTFCLRNHNTSHSYHRQQTLFFTIVLLLLYCINSKHMWN